MENRRRAIPEELLMKLAKQFDEFGGILTVDGVTSPDKIGVLHILETVDENGESALQMPPFQQEIISREEL